MSRNPRRGLRGVEGSSTPAFTSRSRTVRSRGPERGTAATGFACARTPDNPGASRAPSGNPAGPRERRADPDPNVDAAYIVVDVAVGGAGVDGFAVPEAT